MRHWVFFYCLIFLAACSDDVTNKPSDDNVRVDPPNNSVPDTDSGQDASDDENNTNNIVIPDIGACEPGTVSGCADTQSRFVCKEDGSGLELQDCPGEQNCLAGECSDMACIPGTITCEGAEQVKRCNEDGSGYLAPTDCPTDTICSSGSCQSICELGKYQASYIGCEYWTVDLDNYPDPFTNPKPNEVPHAVVISNPGNSPATIGFYSQSASVSVSVPDPVVPAKSARAFTMPRLDVDGTGITRNSINIVSSLPVSAHQFNPLNNESVFSNDASLLLPTNVLGTDYYVVAWPTQYLPCIVQPCPQSQHSYVTVVATSDGDTFLNVTATANIAGGPNINPFPAGVTRSFQLSRGQVLNLQAFEGSLNGKNDLTGTFIRSTKPIAVFVGHEEAVIGEQGYVDPNPVPNNQNNTSCCADHLEQQLYPLNSWSNSYVLALSPGRGQKKDHWRIVAGEDNVTITTNPPQQGANNVTLNKGQFVTFFSNQNFEVNATGKILVGQFLVSQAQTTEGNGDPAFVLPVPTEAFRKDYFLLTPTGYSQNFVTITRKPGVAIELDGVPVTANFVPVGSGAWEVAAISLTEGPHSLESAEPFGLTAFGFSNAVSYAYPGGLNVIGSMAPEN